MEAAIVAAAKKQEEKKAQAEADAAAAEEEKKNEGELEGVAQAKNVAKIEVEDNFDIDDIWKES